MHRAIPESPSPEPPRNPSAVQLAREWALSYPYKPAKRNVGGSGYFSLGIGDSIPLESEEVRFVSFSLRRVKSMG